MKKLKIYLKIILMPLILGGFVGFIMSFLWIIMNCENHRYHLKV